jgi:hypothetical protein
MVVALTLWGIGFLFTLGFEHRFWLRTFESLGTPGPGEWASITIGTLFWWPAMLGAHVAEALLRDEHHKEPSCRP